MKSELYQSEIIDQIRQKYSEESLMILESQMKGHPSSLVSYLAIKPVNTIRAIGNQVEWVIDGKAETFKMNPWNALKQFRNLTKGWLFGFMAYELKDHIEDLKSKNQALTSVPDLYFFEPDLLFRLSEAQLEKWSENSRFEKVYWEKNTDSSIKYSAQSIHLNGSHPLPMIDRVQYRSTVLDIQKRIEDGNFYELNYSYPLTGNYLGDAYDLYRRMRQINPVPYGSFINFEDFSVCCASPERFLRKIGNKIISEPIKGTAERSVDPELDRFRQEELMNEKNRAENLMIVDLVRHDLSKIAKQGSVKVAKLYDIQSFGTVHQLISTIEANVGDDVHPVDIIKNCFPMGSMTGAPKIEVMKVIEEIESYRRGLYSGSIGYFDPIGDFDFNVVIRTAILQDQRVVYPVGGAITSDSDPDLEWHETEVKARAITNVFDGDG